MFVRNSNVGEVSKKEKKTLGEIRWDLGRCTRRGKKHGESRIAENSGKVGFVRRLNNRHVCRA